MPYRKGEKGFQRKYRPQGDLPSTVNHRPFNTVWIEPRDPAYKSEGEWVTVRDAGNYWEGYLADSPGNSLEITWFKDLYEIDESKKYVPIISDYFIAWIVPLNNLNKRAPIKCKVRDFTTYWRGRRTEDDESNPEESWPKIAYKIIHRAELPKVDKA
jgi:hypothetical protein